MYIKITSKMVTSVGVGQDLKLSTKLLCSKGRVI